MFTNEDFVFISMRLKYICKIHKRHKIIYMSDKTQITRVTLPTGFQETQRERERERERERAVVHKLQATLQVIWLCKINFVFRPFVVPARSTIRHIIQRGYSNALCNEKISRGWNATHAFSSVFFFFLSPLFQNPLTPPCVCKLRACKVT